MGWKCGVCGAEFVRVSPALAAGTTTVSTLGPRKKANLY